MLKRLSLLSIVSVAVVAPLNSSFYQNGRILFGGETLAQVSVASGSGTFFAPVWPSQPTLPSIRYVYEPHPHDRIAFGSREGREKEFNGTVWYFEPRDRQRLSNVQRGN